QIRQEVRQFIEHDLRLTIAEEKSHICHSKKGVTFVGYELKTYSADRVIKLKRGTRHTWVKSLSEQIQLHIPQDTMQKFCTQRGSQARRQKRARDTLHQCLSPERPQKTSTARLSTRCPTQRIRLDAKLLRSHQTAQQEAMRVL